ncbi:MAG: ribonuclease III family protein [Candidatus Lokiarchaeota archaeon]|nr:ribonuclease III family protein [Candidatus Lokiarchaeota archaeon]
MDEISSAQKQWIDEWEIEIDPPHFLIAATHPSYHAIDPTATDYERFEFVGDACLDLLVAEFLYNSDMAMTEGEMTRRRTKMVKNDQLAQLFDILQLQQVIITAPNYHPSIKDKANFVEALFGGIFLANGYESCKKLWNKLKYRMGNKQNVPSLSEDEIHPKIRNEKEHLKKLYRQLGLIPKDPITILQELSLKNKNPLPKYKLLQRRGPDHHPLFAYQVSISPFQNIVKEEISAIGTGSSKQKAKFDAAAKLCEKIYLPFIPV